MEKALGSGCDGLVSYVRYGKRAFRRRDAALSAAALRDCFIATRLGAWKEDVFAAAVGKSRSQAPRWL